MTKADQDIDWPLVVQNDDGIRPAGKPNQCFYCKKYIGEPHGKECVCVTKRIKVRYAYEIEVDIPHFWTAEDFEFSRNESSWCASNAEGHIEQYLKTRNEECPCSYFKAEFIEDVDLTPKREIIKNED